MAVHRNAKSFREDAPGHSPLRQLDMERASRTQTRLLPQQPPLYTRMDCSAICKEAFPVGGDFYDFLAINGRRLGIALGDVSGKGLTAALLMANLQGRLESLAPLRELDICRLMADLNSKMNQATSGDQYSTLFYGVYDDGQSTLTYANAGHLAPMLFRAKGNGTPDRLKVGGKPIGLFPDGPFRQETVSLSSGDILVIFSDGLVEAQNKKGEEFGEDRIVHSVLEYSGCSANEIRNHLTAQLNHPTSGPFQIEDDLTLVVVKVGRQDARKTAGITEPNVGSTNGDGASGSTRVLTSITTAFGSVWEFCQSVLGRN